MSNYKYNKHVLAAAAAMTMLFAQSAFAGETVELNLDEAMRRAFETNPAISVANYSMDSARASYNAARQSRGISISGTHQSGRGGYNDEQFVKDYGIYTKGIGNSHSNGISASLPIYTGGKLSGTIQQAKAGYDASVAGVQLAYNDMRTTVTNGYFSMLQADRMQQLSKESVERLNEHLKNVQAQYNVGVVAKVDVLRSQVEVADAQTSLIKAENAYSLAEANLNKIVGLPLDTVLKLDNNMNYTAYDVSLDGCLDSAALKRPELVQAKANVEAAKGALKVARSGYMPQIGATASENWGGSGSTWPGDDKGHWAVGVGVNMNLFDTGVTLSKIHGAEADLAKAEANYRDAVDSINLDVRQNYYNMREAEKRIQSTGVAVEQAREDYRIAQVRYQAGVGTNTDVLDAQVALTNAETNYSNALYDYNTSKTKLLSAMGEPMVNPTVPVVVEPAADKTADAEESK